MVRSDNPNTLRHQGLHGAIALVDYVLCGLLVASIHHYFVVPLPYRYASSSRMRSH